MDKFRVEVISKTPNPQQTIYAAMHQDYTDEFVYNERNSWPSESEAGEIIVKRLLAGQRGHYGPLEHPQIVFNCGYFPHGVMQQARTHRVGVSFDVQCLSYDTEITLVNCEGETNEKLKKSIGELYNIWTKNEKQDMGKMPLRVLDEGTGIFKIGNIKDVICSGIQPVYRVSLEDGKTLDCTVNHRLFTSEGWLTMGDAVGLITKHDGTVLKITNPCYLMCNGLAVAENPIEQNSHHKQIQAHPVKVKTVEYLGLQMTYDLEVEGNWHNFVANGVVVHNSFRYTGNQFIEVAEGKKDIEDVFYLRPVGYYADRQGKKYYYSPEKRTADLQWCLEAVKQYKADFESGMSEEHIRGKMPFDYRQHFVVSFNLRSLLHFLDLRNKKDAQLEIQKLCELMWPHFQKWSPAIAAWYEKTRLGKARLAP
ncbi:FAD-dependent thymidylate synthase [Anabaena sp. FACHB-1237]|nr:FAD-dependent thymidylate synthase [Anabaena sp. FACHB-1237]